MQAGKDLPWDDRLVIFIEKWAIIFLTLLANVFISFKIIYSVFNPPPEAHECGTGLIAAIFGHFFFMGIFLVIITIKMFRSEKYTFLSKTIALLSIIVPPFISLFSVYS